MTKSKIGRRRIPSQGVPLNADRLPPTWMFSRSENSLKLAYGEITPGCFTPFPLTKGDNLLYAAVLREKVKLDTWILQYIFN